LSSIRTKHVAGILAHGSSWELTRSTVSSNGFVVFRGYLTAFSDAEENDRADDSNNGNETDC
jgi:hypothetical protein